MGNRRKTPIIQIILFDWFGVVVGELTSIVIREFELNEDQQQAIRSINFLSDHKYAPVEDVYSVYAKLMAENTGRSWSPVEAKTWLDDNASVDRGLLALISEVRHRGVRVVVASNAASDHRTNMANMGMLDCFDELYVSSLIGHTKPNPDFFEYILEDNALVPAEALFIDDTLKNVVGARAAGLQAEQYGDYGDLEKASSILARYNLI